jgi:hypothetical protein
VQGCIAVLAVALLPPLLGNELVIPSVIMAPMLAAGVWCMPTSMLRKPYGSVLTLSREVWTRQVAVFKSWQLLVSAATAVILVLMDLIELQVAGAAGMAVALGMSLISGVTKDKAAPESTEDAAAS